MKDQTGGIDIVLFGSVQTKYQIRTAMIKKKMRIQKFMNNRILKSTESTSVTEYNNINIELTNDKLNASPKCL